MTLKGYFGLYLSNRFLIDMQSIVPKIERFSAQTSIVAFPQEFIRQWYWKIYRWLFNPFSFEHSWSIDSQSFCFAAIFQDSASLGHRSTKSTVSVEIWHPVKVNTLKRLTGYVKVIKLIYYYFYTKRVPTLKIILPCLSYSSHVIWFIIENYII